MSYNYTNGAVMEAILLNNWFDDSLVPTIQETTKDEFGNSINNYYSYNVKGEPVMIALI
jgi:hypothetical protein